MNISKGAGGIPLKILRLIKMSPYIWENINREETTQKVDKIALQATGEKSKKEAYRSIVDSSDRCLEFHNLLLRHERKLKRRAYKYQIETARTNQYKKSICMTAIAAAGVGSCMLFITFCKEFLNDELINVVHTIAGIFGACLRDAFTFEFGGVGKKGTFKECMDKTPS